MTGLLFLIKDSLSNKNSTMKKNILLATVMLACSINVKACDICGCGVGNNYTGILPDFSKYIFGIRLRYSALITHVGVGGSASYLTTNESFLTTEIWGG